MRASHIVISALLLSVCSEAVGRRSSRKKSQKFRALESDEDTGLASSGNSWISLFQAEQALVDPCQDERGKARRCIPDFENAAYQRKVHASSTCGKTSMRLCQVTPSGQAAPGLPPGFGTPLGVEELVRTCQVCDRKKPSLGHPASLLTDLHNPSKLTCWMSEPFSLNSREERNVSLRLSLGKKFELTYISLQFCGSGKPDSLAIFKSSDYGISWQPFQYYSTSCQKTYGRPARSPRHISFDHEHEPLCSDPNGDTNSQSSTRIAFSTLEGRPSAYEFDQSPLLQDWVTATDIRIDFRRLLNPSQQILPDILPRQKDINGNKGDSINDDEVLSETNDSLEWAGNDSLSLSSAPTGGQELKQQNSYYFYSIADLAIGGRCKCNGHASRCVKKDAGIASASRVNGRNSTDFEQTDGGNVECECRHNTAGRDCERCAAFFFDRPWARATASDANECKPCQCNGHSRVCRFNMELYKLSGFRSGGVCVKCRHNTAGRHCHTCREGFYRNPALPSTQKKTCKACECHPVGSLGRICNMTSGQCPCKDGVTGLTCNRCQKGYQQSRSPIAPCIRIHDPNELPIVSAHRPAAEEKDGTSSDTGTDDEDYEDDEGRYDEECANCHLRTTELSFGKFCKRNFVIQATLLSREEFGDWVRFSIEVNEVFKAGASKVRRATVDSLWVPRADLRCRCPNIKLKATYIILGSNQMHGGRMSMTGDRNSSVLDANEENVRRLRRYQGRARRCPKV
ncbi:netrin-1-like [Varroa jacobsoni]|uniref:netrin-1-like n=1 Tax=Varroa jacobsoni TaxID=62625 RepID=UPI000BF49F34|nr:netrin-1-like [Varroa jacobsoni]